RLVEELEPERDLSRTPLFQVLFSLEHTKAEESARPAFEMYPLRVDTGTAKVDLALYLLDGEDGLRGAIEYSTDLFEAATVGRMASHFVTLLSAAADAPDARLSELPLMGGEEERVLLRDFNDTARDYPREETVHRLFERQAALSPEAAALAWGLEQMSYAELNARANRLARRLRSLGVGAETRVGVLLERSPDAVVSLLAVLKAGGAYVPLDAQYPRERLSFMLSDAGVGVLITREALRVALPPSEARIICLDSERDEIESQSAEDLPASSAPDNLAYVIYTSGSTGVPKGVSVTHRAVVRLVRGANYVEFREDDCFLLLAPLAFDASTFEIWGALLNGARLAVMPAAQPSLEELGRAVRDYGVTTLWLTSGLFHLMVDEQLEDLAGLRHLLTGGDVVSPAHARKFAAASEGCALVNCYGPTENTTFTTFYPVRSAEDFGASVPIGRPVTNTRVYILDSHMRPVPAGVPGELYTAGEGLARGYLNRPELTAERFVPDPFSTEPGGRLYRTGDLCRFRADGALEFIARIDNQVKVRGFRIELGEIEAALSACANVREAAAVVSGEGVEKRIVAYVVGSEPGGLSAAELREQLKERLPEYMMPSAFVLLGALPLTANGKLDRAALPSPSDAEGQEEDERPAARTGIEELVCDIWAQVLGVGSVGPLDNFFEVGGHSLLATQVIARVRESLGVALEVRSLFESPTAAEFAEAVAAALRGGLGAESEPVRRANRKKQQLALSYNQQRLWFLDRLTPGLTLYNVPVLYRLRGKLDAAALEKSLNEIVRRHEVLRTRIGVADGSPVQVVDKPKKARLELLDLGGEADAREREAELKR
ncbi:MAG TPA: amino acid adenylation domain-containing protein, partial [Pyrinomonadaceae bacterium]|nr:amino acid adenylation domain-containing protein [Pyrinomonadaceae bacterium]